MIATLSLAAAYDPDDIKPGWIALGIVVALAVATYLLWRNMNTQLRRIDVPTRAELAKRDGRDGREGMSAGSGDGMSAGSSDGAGEGETSRPAVDPDRRDEGNSTA